MPTLLLDELRAWHMAGGPPEWRAALDRVRGWFEPHWQGVDTTWDGIILLDGAAALALALYITARERDIPVDQVTREQVDRLAEPRGWDRVAAWEDKLRTLGKVANCQIGVSVHAVTDTASCPLGWRLFLPESWDTAKAGPAAVKAAKAKRRKTLKNAPLAAAPADE